MKDAEVKNIEDMTNKLVEYVWATEREDKAVKIDLCMIAAKFILLSFAERGSVECHASTTDILSRCTTVAMMCMGGGERSNG